MKIAKLKIIGILSLTVGIAVGATFAQEVRITKQIFGNAHGEYMLPTFDLVTNGGAIDAKPVKGAPVAAEFSSESVQNLADGNRIVRRSTSQFYRDGEGRTRREQSSSQLGMMLPGNSSDARQISIYDPISSNSYTLNSLFRTAHRNKIFSVTVNASDKPAKDLPSSKTGFQVNSYGTSGKLVLPAQVEEMMKSLASRPAMEKPREEQLGTRDIEGTEAEGKRTTTVLPAGYLGNERPIEIVRETWYSKELQMIVMTNTKNPMTGEQTYKLTKLQRAEQPRSLFEVPTDYKIVDGSQMFNHLFEREQPIDGSQIQPFFQTAPDGGKQLIRLERFSN